MLQTIIGYIVSAVLGWLAKELHVWYQNNQTKKADEKKTSDVLKETQDAKTEDQRKQAASDVINNI